MISIVQRGWVVAAAACLMALGAPAVGAASDFLLTNDGNDAFRDSNLHYEHRWQPAIVLGAVHGLAARFPNVRGQVENITDGGAGAR